MSRLALTLLLALLATQACTCTGDASEGLTGNDATTTPPPPPPPADAGPLLDTGPRDTGPRDTGVHDSGVHDTGVDDTGVDDTGVPDSGTSTTACTQASDCAAGDRAPPLPPICMNTVESCIENSCLLECTASRTCDWDPARSCLDCQTSAGTESACTLAPPCFPNLGANFYVESTNCALLPGTNMQFAGTQLSLSAGGPGCSFELQPNITGVARLGMIHHLSDNRFYGELPGFGGSCSGEALPTGAYRVHWGCPDCEFIVVLQ